MYNAPLSLKGLDVFLVLTQHSSTCHVIHLTRAVASYKLVRFSVGGETSRHRPGGK